MKPDLDNLPLLRAYLTEQFPAGVPDLRIHPNDEMVQQWGSADERDHDHALVYYFRGARFPEHAIQQVARWRFGGLERVERLLDFAAGYGRVTRMLLRHLPPSRVTVTEINHEAVLFQRNEFGVDARLSTTEPEDFRCEQRFDLIYAGSLFTHLPERTFRKWIRKLWSLRNPRGVFIFSLHNERAILEDGTAPPDFLFVEESHSRFVDPSEYGNTYISKSHLERMLTEELGQCSFLRIPRGLASYQDLCIVVPEADESFDTLRFDIGPEGYLEGGAIENDGSILLSGWTGNRSESWKIDRVELTLSGRVVATTNEFTYRADVEATFGESLALSGWACRFKPDTLSRLNEVLQIRAFSDSGFDYLLWIGTLKQALMRREWDMMAAREQSIAEVDRKVQAVLSEREAMQHSVDQLLEKVRNLELDLAYLRHDRAELQKLVAGMESSRFWRARNHWFRIKRLLRLTNER